MNRVIALAAGLAMSAVAAPAMATEGTTPVEQAKAVSAAKGSIGFGTGFYGGLELGSVSADIVQQIPLGGGGFVTAPRDLGSGTSYGVFAGYNVRSSNIVYGGELRVLRFDNLVNGLQIDGSTDLRGRIGYVLGDVMVYAAAGWSWSKIKNPAGGGSGDLDGVNYGVGVEYILNDSMFLGADYTARDLDGALSGITPTDADVDTLTVRLGFRF